ncbi:LysR family transcriptional regulator [Lapillicoccus sp.]|uniref:LysR family transcriptional regulator n=1 Tax=Lapillicoccus sp. TaxID=1909287 RepID=UPI0025E9E392|nr:LysR family transcriptional regulator [Lapillicoccus sp.]
MIDLVGLQALSAVRTHGSVVAAAEALGFTPSAVSQQLKKLERQAGAPVLERYGRGVLLTEIGKRLADRGAEVLASMEALQSDLAGATDAVAGRVHLAAFSTAVRGLVAPLLQRIALDGTPLEVTVVEQDPLEALDLVATGRVDVALVHHWGDTVLPVPDHVERVPIGIDLADILVPSGHRLAGRGAVSPADLRSEVFACSPVGSVCHQWLTRMFADVGGPPPIPYWAAEFSSHIALVEHGVAVSLIPRLGRELLPAGVTVLTVADPVPTRTVSLVWRRSMAASPTIRHLRELLTAMAPDLGLRAAVLD